MPKREPHWKFIERVAALVERTLDRSAEIRRNQRLKSVKNPKARPRQCDVTVRTGPPHRRTLSIVEVQKRDRKVDVTIFDGWCVKMGELGAQHLICVSAKGFPKSVIQKAGELGPTVRLATLAELEQQRWQAAGIVAPRSTLNKVTVEKIEFIIPGSEPGMGESIGLNDPLFQTASGQIQSVHDIALQTLQVSGQERALGMHAVIVRPPDSYQYVRNTSLGPIRLCLVVKLEVRKHEALLEFLEYNQIGDSGARTWVMTARVSADGTSANVHETQIAFKHLPDGRLVPGPSHVTLGGPGNISLTIGRETTHIICTRVPTDQQRAPAPLSNSNA